MKTAGKSIVDLNAIRVAEGLCEARERIASAALRAGRSLDEITLVAVSKTKPIEMINAAALAGQMDFGENYVQEALLKNELRPDLRWHLIGSLQTNKVRSITGSFTLIHSVDRLKLAQEIDKEARRAGLVQDILLQMHIGDEESKSGVDQLEAPALIEKISQEFSSLRLCGLMSLPPLTDDEMQAREQFAQLRLALEKWRSILPEGQREFFRILSMGTSSDYEWAILEGATHVRIGTSIFGAREAKGTV